MFYALSDSFTGEHPREYTSGFGNTKYVICFITKKAREKWLEETKLLTARALTRQEALKLVEWISAYDYGCDKIKTCQIYCDRNSNDQNRMHEHIITRRNAKC